MSSIPKSQASDGVIRFESKSSIPEGCDNSTPKYQYTLQDYRHDYEAEIARGRHLLGLDIPKSAATNQEGTDPKPKDERTDPKPKDERTDPKPKDERTDPKPKEICRTDIRAVNLIQRDIYSPEIIGRINTVCEGLDALCMSPFLQIQNNSQMAQLNVPAPGYCQVPPAAQQSNIVYDHLVSQGAGPEVAICEAHLRVECPSKDVCGLNHYSLPYVWQIHVTPGGWQSLPPEVNLYVEESFCDVGTDITVTEMVLTYANGVMNNTKLAIDFLNMTGIFYHPPHLQDVQRTVQLRRLSTLSYGTILVMKNAEDGAVWEVTDANKSSFYTQWRWFYQDGTGNTDWIEFEKDGFTPCQAVLESKYLAGQEVFMFDVDGSADTMCVILNFKDLTMKNLKTKQVCLVRRRPLLVEPSDISTLSFTPWPTVETNPFVQNIPSNWYPVATKCDFELVPINPERVEFHLVASEFYRGVLNHKIVDIYRLQNPFLWHKYHCKRLQLERKGKVKEVQAFHGTDNETAVRSILHQNFDWRLSGKNATLYGQGCYFAINSAFSHKYTFPLPSMQRTMFLARLLVGKYCTGKKTYRRPPPIDPQKPFGELYDSCVDKMDKPRIYVIFDSDQCYPEYVINYVMN